MRNVREHYLTFVNATLVAVAICTFTTTATNAATLTGDLTLDTGSQLTLEVLGTGGSSSTVDANFQGTFSVSIMTSTSSEHGEIPTNLAIYETNVTLDETDPFFVSVGFIGSATAMLSDLVLSGYGSNEGDTVGGTADGTNTFDLSDGDSYMEIEEATVTALETTGSLGAIIPVTPYDFFIEDSTAYVLPGTTVSLTPTGTPGEFDVVMSIQLDWDIVSAVLNDQVYEEDSELESDGPLIDLSETSTLIASGTLSVVPEPATWCLALTALLGLFGLRGKLRRS